jgi:hypothetical protein
MITHYNGSRGPMEIATMPLPYAQNAVNKLRRERTNSSRDAEIAALDAHISKLSEDLAERQDIEPLEPSPQTDAGGADLDVSEILL